MGCASASRLPLNRRPGLAAIFRRCLPQQVRNHLLQWLASFSCDSLGLMDYSGGNLNRQFHAPTVPSPQEWRKQADPFRE